MVGLAIAVRALGYHKIIFNQRRNTVMQKVQAGGIDSAGNYVKPDASISGN